MHLLLDCERGRAKESGGSLSLSLFNSIQSSERSHHRNGCERSGTHSDVSDRIKSDPKLQLLIRRTSPSERVRYERLRSALWAQQSASNKADLALQSHSKVRMALPFDLSDHSAAFTCVRSGRALQLCSRRK